MQIAEMIDSHHEEIIHDISFDLYGNRLASCSSDQTVKIYGKNTKGEMVKQNEFKCHDGPVWRVKWAHPQFGQVIATCSQDKSVCIWEEKKIIEEDVNNTQELKVTGRWIQRCKIQDSKDSVSDIKFGSRHLGLVLAIAYADGYLKIYRMLEQQNLSQILNVGEVMANPNGLRSISWNKSPFEREMIAVGANDCDNAYFRPQEQASADPKMIKFSIQQQALNQSQYVDQKSKNTLTIFCKEEKGQYDQTYTWVPLKHFDQQLTVNDVSWAHLNGRSFHLLATADAKGVKVWKFTVKDRSLDILQTMNVDQPEMESWRVSWNILATMFVASYNKQEVKVFRIINNVWVCQGSLMEEQEKQEINKSL